MKLRKLNAQDSPVKMASTPWGRGEEWGGYTFNLRKLHWSHLLTGKQDWSGGQAQFEICSRGFSQVTGS